jgi:hypothetical protein
MARTSPPLKLEEADRPILEAMSTAKNAPLHTGLFTPVFKSFCPGIHGRSGNPDVKSRLVYVSRNPLKPIVDLMLKSPACNWGFLLNYFS